MKNVCMFRLTFIILSLMLLSCRSIFETEGDPKEIIYSNSFESESDLLNWEGLTVNYLVDEPAPSDGQKSVRITGGCMIPHASITFDPPGNGRVVSICFYGKNIDRGGSVEVYFGDNLKQAMQILISDTSWKEYETPNAIIWPGDSSMTIWMNAGGFIPSAMLIDRIQVLKIKSF